MYDVRGLTARLLAAVEAQPGRFLLGITGPPGAEPGTTWREVAAFLAPQLRATDRFLKFLGQFAPPPSDVRPQSTRIDWDNLEPAFREIYVRRSEALHGGIPIPLARCGAPRALDDNGAYEETIGAIGVWSGTAARSSHGGDALLKPTPSWASAPCVQGSMILL